jgi:O-antigen ligase
MTLGFVFLRFSFLHEFLTAKIGFDTHLLLVLGAAAFLAALLSGGLFLCVSHRICLAWLGFAACMCVATVTSVWKGGSFAVIYPYLRTTLLLVFLIPAVVFTSKDISKALRVIGMAGFVPILLGFSSEEYRTGRLELSGAGQSIANSNDFAALLILVFPAIAYFALRRNTNFVLKMIGLGAMALACYLILGTGSRGALVSIIISTLFVLKAGSAKVKIALLAGLPLLALIAIPFLPGESARRLASLFNSKEQTEESLASQEQRTALLKASLQITLTHPLTGVGPGTFSIYQATEAENVGERGMWHETHNSYTQVSSECGIPALLFYLAAIGMTFSVFRKGMKSADLTTRTVSMVLGLMLVSFSVCMFFLSQAYGFGFPLLGGFAISLDRLLKKEALQPAALPA